MVHRHPFLTLLTGAWLGIVAWMTLGPQPLNGGEESFLFRIIGFFQSHPATQWVTYNHVEFGANIAMFVPVGMFFTLVFGRKQWWLAILVGFLITVGIETAQLSIPGRVSDIRDVIANTSGAVIGVLLVLLLTIGDRRRAPRRVAVTS
jgi:glycopeptide antibiotics resistance protein